MLKKKNKNMDKNQGFAKKTSNYLKKIKLIINGYVTKVSFAYY